MNIKRILMTAFVAFFMLLNIGFADTAEERAAIQEGIDNLLATVDMTNATESPRLGKMDNGGLRYFGAPPNAFAQTNPTKSTAEEKARAFLQDNAMAFAVKSASVNYEMKRNRSVDTRRYLRFEQTYQDIPVFAGEAIVQMDEDDNVSAAILDLMTNTDDLDNENISLIPEITAIQAEAAAIDAVAYSYEARVETQEGELAEGELEAFRDDLITLPCTSLFIYDPQVVGNTGPVCLAWKVTVAGQTNTLEKEVVLVDAASGTAVLEYPLVHSSLNRVIKDQQNNASLEPIVVREEGDPPISEGEDDGNRAYDYLGDVYDFYSSHHGRDSIDNAGMTLEAIIRMCSVDESTCNSKCPCPNAFWDGEKMQFGENFVVDDVVAHELTHGVTENESGLLYINESGAVNESLSDVWGEFIDQTNNSGLDSEEVKWLLGEEVDNINAFLVGTITPAPAIRNMKSPSDYWTVIGSDILHWVIVVYPSSYDSKYFYKGTYDNGGVHVNSSINNKLCYLLTDGGSFNGRVVTGMGIDLVANLYYECQCNLLVEGSNYADLYFALLQASVNLNFTQEQRNNIEKACRAVQIRPTAYINIFTVVPTF